MTRGLKLRIEVLAPAVVHRSTDDWKNVKDTATRDTQLGLHTAEIDVSNSSEGDRILFTFYWKNSNNWECTDFTVMIE